MNVGAVGGVWVGARVGVGPGIGVDVDMRSGTAEALCGVIEPIAAKTSSLTRAAIVESISGVGVGSLGEHPSPNKSNETHIHGRTPIAPACIVFVSTPYV